MLAWPRRTLNAQRTQGAVRLAVAVAVEIPSRVITRSGVLARTRQREAADDDRDDDENDEQRVHALEDARCWLAIPRLAGPAGQGFALGACASALVLGLLSGVDVLTAVAGVATPVIATLVMLYLPRSRG